MRKTGFSVGTSLMQESATRHQGKADLNEFVGFRQETDSDSPGLTGLMRKVRQISVYIGKGDYLLTRHTDHG